MISYFAIFIYCSIIVPNEMLGSCYICKKDVLTGMEHTLVADEKLDVLPSRSICFYPFKDSYISIVNYIGASSLYLYKTNT